MFVEVIGENTVGESLFGLNRVNGEKMFQQFVKKNFKKQTRHNLG